MTKIDPAEHEEKRRQILEAAVRCFSRNGFRRASISGICAEAGISRRRLRQYFASKEAIIEAMVDASLERKAENFDAATQGTSIVSALLAQLDDEVSQQVCGGTPMLLGVFAEAESNPVMAKIFASYSGRSRALLIELLRRGQENGEIDPQINPELIALALSSILDGSRAMLLESTNISAEEVKGAFRTYISQFVTHQTTDDDHSVQPDDARQTRH